MKPTTAKSQCYHCGSECAATHVVAQGLDFCCQGCHTVHQILRENGLDKYYELDDRPGISFSNRLTRNYRFLDDQAVALRFIEFEQGDEVRVRLEIPSIHCRSCIWLLENLSSLHPGISRVRVQFLEKQALIRFDKQLISLRELAELLDKIGYEPNLSPVSNVGEKVARSNKLSLRIAVAGFCFGNAMLFSFPEYFGLNQLNGAAFRPLFAWLNFSLAIPSLFFSGQHYLVSAWKALRQRVVHINVPLATGMLALFLRSAYEIVTATGSGYFDSLTGLVFFLLIGKWVQERSYSHLSFDRDYRSYFPLAVQIIEEGEERIKMLEELKVGDRLRIRNGELIPADGILLRGPASIDYSFVTGESVPVSKELGEMLYAGGKQCGEGIEMEITRELSQGKLTRLWNEHDIRNRHSRLQSFTDVVSKYFTFALLAIAIGTFVFWSFSSFAKAFFAFTSVLIVACPCALALSSPFALGNVMRLFGRRGFYLRNSRIVEDLARVKTILFDKTGTLTNADHFDIEYRGEGFTNAELQAMHSMLAQTNHPLSKSLLRNFREIAPGEITDFAEIPGLGIRAWSKSGEILIGNAKFTSATLPLDQLTHVGVSVDSRFKGYYTFSNRYRAGLNGILQALQTQGMRLGLLSGDGDGERERVRKRFPELSDLWFGKDPVEKLQIVEEYKQQGDAVLMVGDGLNDAGALAVSDVGIVLTESVNNFTPAASAILRADRLQELPVYIHLAQKTMRIIHVSFAISILYNVVGIAFAVQGLLSPVVAAILMPLSSVSVVFFNTIATNFVAKRNGIE